MKTVVLTEASTKLFLSLAKDAGDWNGQPLLAVTAEERGNVTQLKRAKFLKTEMDEGHIWVIFLEAGIKFAAENGIDLSWINKGDDLCPESRQFSD